MTETDLAYLLEGQITTMLCCAGPIILAFGFGFLAVIGTYLRMGKLVKLMEQALAPRKKKAGGIYDAKKS